MNNHDCSILFFSVHAHNAPETVYKWMKNLEEDCDIPMIVISVLVGGEISLNTACRVSVIKILESERCGVFMKK